jgi:hypothetical protein
MTNYTNGKIYKICGGDEVYIGSTCDTLSRRFSGHKSNYKYKKSRYTSYYLFETYGIENCTIELIQDFPCDSKKDLFEREGYYIRTIKCVNKFIVGRNQKEVKHEYMKEYTKTHKEHKNAYMKEYREKNREEHKEKNKEYMKQWHQRKKLADRTAAATTQIIEPINQVN